MNAPGPLTTEAVGLIRAAMAERSMTQAALSRVTGLTEKHISQVLNLRCGCDEWTVVALGEAVGIAFSVRLTPSVEEAK